MNATAQRQADASSHVICPSSNPCQVCRLTKIAIEAEMEGDTEGAAVYRAMRLVCVPPSTP